MDWRGDGVHQVADDERRRARPGGGRFRRPRRRRRARYRWPRTSAPVSSGSVTASAPEPVPMSRTRLRAARAQRQSGFHHVLGLGAGNQHVRRDAELAAVELLALGDVLGRLALQALVQVAAVVQPLHFAAAPVRDGREIDAVAVEGVRRAALRRSGAATAIAASSKSCVPWSSAVWTVIARFATLASPAASASRPGSKWSALRRSGPACHPSRNRAGAA